MSFAYGYRSSGRASAIGRASAGGEASVSAFPLSVSADGRFLQTPTGTPFPVFADSAWAIGTALTSSEIDQYLSTRKAQGFNTLVAQASSPVTYNSSGNTNNAAVAVGAGNALPFLKNTSGGTWTGIFGNHDADFSTPNGVYWDWFVSVLGRCQANGFLVELDWIYFGFNQGAADGWIGDIANATNTTTVMTAFGHYLAAKCVAAGVSNVLFSFGTDTFPTDSAVIARILAFNDGWVAGGGTLMSGGHYQRSSDSLDDADFASRITVNAVYPGNPGSHAATYARCLRAYARSPAKPVFCVESVYEVPGGMTREQVRSYGWWALLSSIAGYTFGNEPTWFFDTGWQTALTSDGSLDASRMFAFWRSLPSWSSLVPDGQGSIGTLVTAGGGGSQTLGSVGSVDGTDGLDHVMAAMSPDGATLAAFVPHGHSGTFAIDIGKMRGTTVQRWLDPTNGAYQSAGSNLANTGTHTFTTPGANASGTNDWVLRLDA
jgi:hypothetical protein